MTDLKPAKRFFEKMVDKGAEIGKDIAAIAAYAKLNPAQFVAVAGPSVAAAGAVGFVYFITGDTMIESLRSNMPLAQKIGLDALCLAGDIIITAGLGGQISELGNLYRGDAAKQTDVKLSLT